LCCKLTLCSRAHQVTIAYSTYGTLNDAGDNGVNVGHSLTSNSNVHEW
jgi:homoserine acetyltransferase